MTVRKICKGVADKLGFMTSFEFPPLKFSERGILIGAGHITRESYDSQDIHQLPGIDICFDLSKTPWPIEDNVYDALVARNVLEHIDKKYFVAVMSEICRITKPGATVIIRLPYWNTSCTAADPTHYWGADFQTMNYFTFGHKRRVERGYYSGDAEFTIDRILYSCLSFPADYEGFAKPILKFIASRIGETVFAIQWRMTNMKLQTSLS